MHSLVSIYSLNYQPDYIMPLLSAQSPLTKLLNDKSILCNCKLNVNQCYSCLVVMSEFSVCNTRWSCDHTAGSLHRLWHGAVATFTRSIYSLCLRQEIQLADPGVGPSAASIWQFFQEATEENICEMFYLYLFETISMRSQRLQSRVAQLPESERMVMVLMMVQEDLMVHILDKMFIDLCFY